MTLYPISPEMVSRRAQGSTNIFKQHIMHALMDAGYTDSIYGSLFNKLFHPRVGLAFADAEYPDVRDVIVRIHDAGGIAVLAHPACCFTLTGLDRLVNKLIKLGLDGIEVYYPYKRHRKIIRFHSSETVKRIAEKYKLIKTGGTDEHGNLKI